MPDKSFLVDGKEHNVPCIFQIWEKKETNRIVNEKLEPLNFLFVKKTENLMVPIFHFVELVLMLAQ